MVRPYAVRRRPGRRRPLPLGGASSSGREGLQLLQEAHAVGDLARVGWVDEGEAGDVAEAEARHLEDDRGEVGAQDLRVGELWAAVVVVLGVEPDRDAVGDAAAAARALVGAGLAHRLDREALHLGALAVAADAGRAGVDDVADARHRQRRLGDVGGQDDSSAGVGGEDTVLLGGGEPAVERDDFGDRQLHASERIGRVTDLALPGEEDEDVAARARVPFGPELLDGVADPGDHVALLRLRAVGVDERAVADLDGEGPPRHLDDRRGSAVGSREVLREALRVDRRRRDDDLEVGSTRQELLEVAEDEVDVEAALVRLVDDDRVVAAQLTVALHLGEQDAVGHHLDEGVPAALVGEAHLVADSGPELDGELLRQPLGDRPRRDAPRLRVADDPVEPAAELEADLRDLGRLAGAGLAGDDDDLVVADGGRDVVAPLDDGQVLRIGDGWQGGRPRRPTGLTLLRGRLGTPMAPRAFALRTLALRSVWPSERWPSEREPSERRPRERRPPPRARVVEVSSGMPVRIGGGLAAGRTGFPRAWGRCGDGRNHRARDEVREMRRPRPRWRPRWLDGRTVTIPGGSVTDSPSRPDPLPPDNGSARAAAGRGRNDGPDPTVDRYSAFDQLQPPPPPRGHRR